MVIDLGQAGHSTRLLFPATMRNCMHDRAVII